MIVVDTNILIYAANTDSPEHEICRELLQSYRKQAGPWYLTWGVVYEFLRVVTHPRVFRTPWSAKAGWSFVAALLASPSLRVLEATDRHTEVLAELIREFPHLAGNIFHDAHTAALLREHGLTTIVTRDTDFHRFGFLDVVDPLAG